MLILRIPHRTTRQVLARLNDRVHGVIATNGAWIDLLAPDAQEIEQVQRQTGLRVPTQDEVSEIESTSRLASREGAYYLSAPLVAPRAHDEYVHVPAGLVLSKKHLVTVRWAPIPAIDAAFKEAAPDAEGSFLKLLEVIVDRSADALERAAADSDLLSHEAFNAGKRTSNLRDALRRVGALADRTSHVRDSLLSIGRIAAYVNDGLDDARLKAVRADITSLTEYESHLSSKIQFLLDATLGFINVEQNEVVKILTIASVVGIPPVLIAGIYGMNFKFMPELQWKFGYPYAIALMIVSGLLPLLWFRKRGWI
jgi:magnesium transporter